MSKWQVSKYPNQGCANCGEDYNSHNPWPELPCPKGSANITLTVSRREFFTMLAALRLWQETKRLWQETNSRFEDWMQQIATDGDTVQALDDNEIDELCERINYE